MADSNKSGFAVSPTSNIAQLYRSIYTSDPSQRLPSAWISRDRTPHIKVSVSGLTITCFSASTNSRQSSFSAPVTIKSIHPIPLRAGLYYFETTIVSFDSNCSIAIGVASKRTGEFPGWDSSFGYYSDGSVYHSANLYPFGPKFTERDVVGCGVDLISKSLFFTKNGDLLGKAFEGKLPVSTLTDLYPAIGLDGQGCSVTTNFGNQPFIYPFKQHIALEREAHENRLLGGVSKDLLSGKMQDLVAGYLVHHGYIDSARVFSRWSNLSNSGSSSSNVAATTTMLSSSSSVAIREDEEEKKTEELEQQASIPGFASILHRRSLRAYCHQCQYGRAVNSLTALYPSVVERYPELIVQLRCRQLIEMMHRHSEQQSSQHYSEPRRLQQSTTRQHKSAPSTFAGAARSATCTYTSESIPSSVVCDDNPSVIQKCTSYRHRDMNHVPAPGSSAATSFDAMDIDSSLAVESNDLQNDHISPAAYSFMRSFNHCLTETDVSGGGGGVRENQDSISQPSLFHIPTDDEDVFGRNDGDDDDDDDDGFGLAENLKSRPCVDVTSDATSMAVSVEMDGIVDGNSLQPGFVSDANGLLVSHSCTSFEGDHDFEGILSDKVGLGERRRLLRQIQFGRSLMNLVNQTRKKCGTLSPETERLVEQSVGLLAYRSPSSPDCPLRCLLDLSCRDNIASLINSAILTEAHKLPPQPAIEQGLYALQRCFSDRQLEKAQTLGHFLLYHLSPSQYAAEINRNQQAISTSPTDPVEYHSTTYTKHQEGSLLHNTNSLVRSNGVSNGRASPPKRHHYAPPSSSTNGISQRQWRRRSGNISRPVVSVASTDEEDDDDDDDDDGTNNNDDDDDISMGEEVGLQNDEADEDENAEFLDEDDEAIGVDLITAAMEEDLEEDEKSDDEGEEDEDEEGLANRSSFAIESDGQGGTGGVDIEVRNNRGRGTSASNERSRPTGIRPRRFSRLSFGAANAAGEALTRSSRRGPNASINSPSTTNSNNNNR